MTREYRREAGHTRDRAVASDFVAESRAAETPAERLAAAAHAAGAGVSELEAAIASVNAATEANKPAEWDQATGRFERAKERAADQLARAEKAPGDDTENAAKLATVRARYEAALQTAPAARPDGVSRLSVETELEAIRAKAYPAPEGTTLRDWSVSINAEIATVVCGLSTEDARALRGRMSQPAPSDKLAQWLNGRGTRASISDDLSDALRNRRAREEAARQDASGPTSAEVATGDVQVAQGETGSVAVDGASAPLDALTESEPAREVPFRGEMEQMFGEDFSSVEAHTGADAALDTLGARGAAQGDVVAFASATPDRALVAHELTHVVQQRHAGAGAVALSRTVSQRGDDAEREAEAVAAHVSSGQTSASPLRIEAKPTAGLHLDRTQDPQPGAGDTGPKTDPAIQRATSLAILSVQHLATIQTVLAEAFRASVSAMDARGARELATQIIGGLSRIRDSQQRIPELVPQLALLDGADPKARQVPQVSTPDSAPVVDPVELMPLLQLKTQLDTTMQMAVSLLSYQMSPQLFDGEAVAGAIEAAPATRDGVSYIAREASAVIDLLETADLIGTYVMPEDEQGSSVPADPDNLKLAVSSLEHHKSRPVNFLFLVRVLKRRELWSSIERVQAFSGKTAGGLETKVKEQAGETGATADVGPYWDRDEADSALTYGMTDWAVTDGDAMGVVEMLGAASPQARPGLVKQLHRMGLLGRLGDNVGWQYIKQIADSIHDREAEDLLAPYWEGKGGVPSSHEFFQEQVDDNLEEGGAINTLNAFGWYFLDSSLDTLSFGGKASIDRAHEARDDGWISDDAYWAEAWKATGRTIAVGAAAAATGGAAGAWAEGAAGALGATEAGAAMVGGAMGGAVGNVGAHFVGDAYDQLLSGKEGFDSFGDYATDFAVGGVMGATLAPVGYYGAKYLPASARNMSQTYAVHHPEMIGVLEASRAAGAGAGFRVRMSARAALDFMRGGGGGGGFGGFGGMQPAFATGGAGFGPADLAALPPDAEVWVTARPIGDLNAPTQRLGDEADQLFEVESVEPVFDSYGDEASYADDAADWRSDGDDFGVADDGVDDIGLADAQGRRTRHVPDGEMSPEMADEYGMSVLDEARLGITRDPRHHTLPQEEIAFFQARGFPGREIDAFTVELPTLDHEMLHGGNQSLARRHWREQEWNTELMKRLRADEAELQLTEGPNAKISRDRIMKIMEKMRAEFAIADLPYVDYDAPNASVGDVGGGEP